MYENITGIILAGGKSSRMGQDKSFLEINGRTVIERVLEIMGSVFSKLMIVTNTPEKYNYIGIETHVDIYKNVGPLAGIHSGLVHSATEKNFVISCDIPMMNAQMIAAISTESEGHKITIPRADSYLQQLCGVYSKSALPMIEKIIEENTEHETRDAHQHKRKCKVHHLLTEAQAHVIENIEELPGYSKHLFLNMNRPEDYEQVLQLLGRR